MGKVRVNIEKRNKKIENSEQTTTGPKRTEFERERDLEVISRLHLEGKTQNEITELLQSITKAPYKLNRTQITKDIQALRKHWLDSSIINIDLERQIILEKIGNLEKRYWASFNESLSAKTKVIRGSMVKNKKGDADDQKQQNGGLMVDQTTTVIEHGGNVAFLNGVMSCIQKRMQILGLDQHITVNNTTVSFNKDDFGNLTNEELAKWLLQNNPNILNNQLNGGYENANIVE